jgi:hypothetical protein
VKSSSLVEVSLLISLGGSGTGDRLRLEVIGAEVIVFDLDLGFRLGTIIINFDFICKQRSLLCEETEAIQDI